MNRTPKSLRLHIGIVGRTNTGKSSFVNYITGQDVSIISPVPGTTTDVVEKTIELLPLGPVVLMDTAGSDDTTDLASLRLRKSARVMDRCDLVCLVVETPRWTGYEQKTIDECKSRDIPLLVVVSKIDQNVPDPEFLNTLETYTPHIMLCSNTDLDARDKKITELKEILIRLAPSDYLQAPELAEDLVPPGGHAVLIIPIDIEAPKGRLILPQVQTLRALLDAGAAGTVVKEEGYPGLLENLKAEPDLVVCDSQVVDFMIRETPDNVPATTFSILFARYKGDLSVVARGAGRINTLWEGHPVPMAEACTPHPMEDDIGRVKIPAWIEACTGVGLQWTVAAGRDYPEDLGTYSLIIHCGGCMLNRRAMLNRIQQAQSVGVPITNYGLAIAAAHGLGERVLSPFPEALNAYRESCSESGTPYGKVKAGLGGDA